MQSCKPQNAKLDINGTWVKQSNNILSVDSVFNEITGIYVEFKGNDIHIIAQYFEHKYDYYIKNVKISDSIEIFRIYENKNKKIVLNLLTNEITLKNILQPKVFNSTKNSLQLISFIRLSKEKIPNIVDYYYYSKLMLNQKPLQDSLSAKRYNIYLQENNFYIQAFNNKDRKIQFISKNKNKTEVAIENDENENEFYYIIENKEKLYLVKE